MNLSKKQEYLIIAGLLVLIFPFFALLLYVHPQGDDFFFAYKMQNQGVFDFVKEMYFTWSGRYFSMFLGALDPWVNKSVILLRTSLIIISLFTYSSIFFLVRSTLLSSYSNRSTFSISLAIYALLLSTIISPFEYFFWYPAVSAYQISNALIFYFIAITFLKNSNRISNKVYITVNSIIAILAIGSIELSIIPLFIIQSFSLLDDLKNKKNVLTSVAVFMFIIVASSLVLFAPGNYARHEVLGGSIDVLSAMVLTTKITVFTIGFYFQNPIFLISSILLTSLISYILSANKFSLIQFPSIKPIIFIPASVFIIWLIYFPATLILNHLPPSRVINFVSVIFIIILLIDIILFVNYHKKKISFNISKNIVKFLIYSLLILSFSGIHAINKQSFAKGKTESIFFYGNVTKAYYTLFFEASVYDKQMLNRDSQLRTAENYSYVKPISHKTTLINFIHLNESHYQFNWEAKYYGMDSICIEKKDTLIQEVIKNNIEDKLFYENNQNAKP